MKPELISSGFFMPYFFLNFVQLLRNLLHKYISIE